MRVRLRVLRSKSLLWRCILFMEFAKIALPGPMAIDKYINTVP